MIQMHLKKHDTLENFHEGFAAQMNDTHPSKFPNDDSRVSRISIIDEASGKFVRMANLACVGSHAINGVAAIHTNLLKKHTLRDFNELWPGKVTSPKVVEK